MTTFTPNKFGLPTRCGAWERLEARATGRDARDLSEHWSFDERKHLKQKRENARKWKVLRELEMMGL